MHEVLDYIEILRCPNCDYKLTIVGCYQSADKLWKGYYWCKKCDNEFSEDDIDEERREKIPIV